jgi:hypothetical protein
LTVLAQHSQKKKVEIAQPPPWATLQLFSLQNSDPNMRKLNAMQRDAKM